MDDVQQMIVNEVKRLERAIEKREKALAQLEDKIQYRTSPKRYVLEYDFPVSTDTQIIATVLFQPFVRSFVVDKDSKMFFCQDIAFSMAPVGVISGVTSSNKLTYTPDSTFLLEFGWRIRDTSTDREWQNTALPRYFLASGLTSGVKLPWPAPLKPGAELEMTISPTSASTVVVGFSSVTSITLQVSFVGFEVL